MDFFSDLFGKKPTLKGNNKFTIFDLMEYESSL